MNVALSGASVIALVPAVTLSFMSVSSPMRTMNFAPVVGASTSSSSINDSGLPQPFSLTIPNKKSSVWRGLIADDRGVYNEYSFSFKERPITIRIASTERFGIIVSDDDFLMRG